MSLETTTRFFVDSVEPHKEEVRKIFRETFLLGQPLNKVIENFDLYEAMSLDWYLTVGSKDCAVVVDTETRDVLGYVLVCTKSEDYDSWLRGQIWRVLRKNLALAVTARLSRVGWQFYCRRFLDAITVGRTRNDFEMTKLAHVHINLRNTARTGSAALALFAHADAVCRREHVTSWTGEVNAFAGTREKAIQRLVGEIVDIKVNRTASFFSGQVVNRITVRRIVPQR